MKFNELRESIFGRDKWAEAQEFLTTWGRYSVRAYETDIVTVQPLQLPRGLLFWFTPTPCHWMYPKTVYMLSGLKWYPIENMKLF